MILQCHAHRLGVNRPRLHRTKFAQSGRGVPGGAGFCRRLRASQKVPDFVPDEICLFLRELLPVIFRPHLKNRTLAMRLSVRRAGLHRLHRPKDLLKLVLQHLGNLLPAQKVLLCRVGA